MASGHANRANRPNTWLHRPAMRREVLTCQPGAVHTWHFCDIHAARCNVRTSLGGGHLASLGPSSRLRAVGQRRDREPMLGDELRRLVVDQREVTADESAT